MTSDVHFCAVTDDLSVTVVPHIDGGYAWFVSVGDQDSANDNLVYFSTLSETVEEAFAAAYCAIMSKANVWQTKARTAIEMLLHRKPGTFVWSNGSKYSYAVVYFHDGFYVGYNVTWWSNFRRTQMDNSGKLSSLNEAIAWSVRSFFDNSWKA